MTAKSHVEKIKSEKKLQIEINKLRKQITHGNMLIVKNHV